jgi:hypothetical protein
MANSSRNPIGNNQDITERNSTLDFKDVPYAASVTVNPTKRRTFVRIGQLTGALTINVGVGNATNPPFVNDELIVMFFGDATGRTVTFGTGVTVNAATLVLAAGSKRGSTTFVFDGTAWVETGRSTGV